jgi:hypothetical protein
MIMRAARQILEEIGEPSEVPEGEFWEWAFHRDVLSILCRMREGLLQNCRTDTRKALRAIILGALHGPRPKSHPSYFSNQSPRTYSPKPRYAVNFWKSRQLIPEPVDVLKLLEDRANRYYGQEKTASVGIIIRGDSREKRVFTRLSSHHRVRWVITSPPYYGLRTYIPDQWLRMWFLGGPAHVEYSMNGQMSHASPEAFALQLRQVWHNACSVCSPGAQLVVRFGGINDRRADPLGILRQSLLETPWEVKTIKPAGSAAAGHRQALHFSHTSQAALDEHDLWATWSL